MLFCIAESKMKSRMRECSARTDSFDRLLGGVRSNDNVRSRKGCKVDVKCDAKTGRL